MSIPSTRRSMLLAHLLAACFWGVSCTPAADSPPDVILVVMDTTRADRLGVYGNSGATSPRLDEFSREAVVYDNAWSTASWTLPSHASIFTGLYPSAHGAHISPDVDQDSLGDNPARLAASVVTMAELLAERGYRTGAFAAAGWLAPEFGLLQGYEVQDAKNLNTLRANAITDRAVSWLRTIPAQEPLHLMVNYFDPHGPYDPPKGYRPRRNAPQTGSARSDTKDQPEQDVAVMDLYDGEIRFMDHHLGRLLDALRGAGRYEEALIIITADHGELFGEHGVSSHGAWLYEEVLHVPLIVRLPGGRRAGSRRDAPVSLVDLLPLVTSEVGLELPEGVDGVPLEERELVLAEEFPSGVLKKLFGDSVDRDLVAGIRWPWKLIVSSTGDSELYRLDRDPREQAPIEDPRIEEELRREVTRIRDALVAPPPDPDPPSISPEMKTRLKELGYLE